MKNYLSGDGGEDEVEIKECHAVTRQSNENSEPEGLDKQPGTLQIGPTVGPSVVFTGRCNGGTGQKPCMLLPAEDKKLVEETKAEYSKRPVADLGRYTDDAIEDRGYSLQMVMQNIMTAFGETR